MTEPPEPRRPAPAHLRPITVEIPVTWTPDQALAVFELLDELKQKIWGRYEACCTIAYRNIVGAVQGVVRY